MTHLLMGILDDFGSCQTSYRWGFGEVNCDLSVNRTSNNLMTTKHLLYGFFSGLIGVTLLIHPMSQPARKNTNNVFAGTGFACHFAITCSEFLYIVRCPPKRPKLKETHVAFTANRRPFPTSWSIPKFHGFHGGGLVNTRRTCA